MKVQTEDKNFSRDINNKALINNNIGALQRRRMEKKRQDKLSDLENEVGIMKQDLQEIKSLLKELTNR
jgi:hypothetical protein